MVPPKNKDLLMINKGEQVPWQRTDSLHPAVLDQTGQAGLFAAHSHAKL